jgi:hypothetical protein
MVVSMVTEMRRQQGIRLRRVIDRPTTKDLDRCATGRSRTMIRLHRRATSAVGLGRDTRYMNRIIARFRRYSQAAI